MEYTKACLKEGERVGKIDVQNNIDLLPQKVSTNEKLNPLQRGERRRRLIRGGPQALQCPHTGFRLFH
jgi:hypothetical protein